MHKQAYEFTADSESKEDGHVICIIHIIGSDIYFMSDDIMKRAQLDARTQREIQMNQWL